MPCQLMVGFFAYAKTLEINVDKEELEGTLTLYLSSVDCISVLLSGYYIVDFLNVRLSLL